MAAEEPEIDFRDVQHKYQGVNFLSRYQQNKNVHDLLRTCFFPSEITDTLENLKHMIEHSTYYSDKLVVTDEGMERRKLLKAKTLDAETLNLLNMRVITFHVEIVDEKRKVRIVNTLPDTDIFCTNVELIKEWADTDDPKLISLIKKLYNDIYADELTEGTYLYSYEFYYHRGNYRSGLWHRDITSGMYRDPEFVSLEYFIEGVYLGPEVIQVKSAKEIYNYESKLITSVSEAIRNKRPIMRVLIQDGSVLTLNNHESFHATPYTGITVDKVDYSELLPLPQKTLLERQHKTFDGYVNPDRYEQREDEHAKTIVENTQRGIRSFIRGKRNNAPLFSELGMEEIDVSEWYQRHKTTLFSDLITWSPAKLNRKHLVGGGLTRSIPMSIRKTMSKTGTVLPNFIVKNVLIHDVPLEHIDSHDVVHYLKLEKDSIGYKGGKSRKKRYKN